MYSESGQRLTVSGTNSRANHFEIGRSWDKNEGDAGMSNSDLNEVNHSVLRRQHLTEDSRIDDVVKIVSDIGGLHATATAVPYLSLFARTRNFNRIRLDEELYHKRTLGKIRCMRKTLFIITREMIPITYAATKGNVEKYSEKFLQSRGISSLEYQKISKQIIKTLHHKEMSTSEIRKTLKTNLNISEIVNLMCDRGSLIRTKPVKGWKDRRHRYSVFGEFFPEVKLSEIGEDEARASLVKQYLASFGPATERDISWWIGEGITKIRESLDNIRDQTTEVGISGIKGNFIILSSEGNLLRNSELSDIPTINLLPVSDPYPMGYKERKRYLDHKHFDNVFDRSGNATSTIVLNGRVVGIWDIIEGKDPLIKLFFFEDVEETILSIIHAEAKRIGRFISDREVKIKECEDMIPLTKRTAGAFMTPLRDS
ncbi:MAG: winged helix DNA-binding domain-containing protein [Candidatus Hodarchaeota archaeon]